MIEDILELMFRHENNVGHKPTVLYIGEDTFCELKAKLKDTLAYNDLLPDVEPQKCFNMEVVEVKRKAYLQVG